MTRRYLKSITVKALFAIFLAFLATYFVSVFFSGMLNQLLLNISEYEPIELVQKYNWIAFAMIGCNIFVFVVIFVILVKKRIGYLNTIIQSVSKIEETQFLPEIKVEGSDEFAELATSINTMSRRLEERFEHEKQLEQSKYELITAVSHDLKTPLTSLIGYLDLLHQQHTHDEYVQIAYQKSLRLKDLVNELFEYTKLTSHDFEIEKKEINLVPLVNQYVGESILDFQTKEILVKLENPFEQLIIVGDINLLSRVFENLLNNGQKYSDIQSTFSVKVKDIGSEVAIAFTNQCSDMTDVEAEKLFEKFYRVDRARTQQQEGSGLGLTIAKRIVELHLGKLEVKKQSDELTFTVILPILKKS